MKQKDVEIILETYSLEEIMEQNDLTDVDVVLFLLENEMIELPEPLPLVFDD